MAASMALASVGIFAHNEKATIQQVVEGFLAQQLSSVAVYEVVVVCCGCTDDTIPIAHKISTYDTRVRLLIRPQREGKIAAINEFLRVAKSDILILASGDVVPEHNVVELLVTPLIAHDRCLMTGPQILPTARIRGRTLVDELHVVLWRLHHAVAMRRPKLGEIVAVRRDALECQLPTGAHCDEALLESIVAEHGGSLTYVPEAHAYNFAPPRLGDLYQQRRRIAAQHRVLKQLRGYRPATSDPLLVLRALGALPWRRLPVLVLLTLLESAARQHGWWDVSRGRSYRLWRVDRPESRADHRIATGRSHEPRAIGVRTTSFAREHMHAETADTRD
jgi:biofilm PGA synthesis N-glycosyltransferase PgaC